MEYFQEKNIYLVCLSETWFYDDTSYQTSLFNNVGHFSVFNRPRVTDTIGGGVCILMKDHIKSKQLKNRVYSSFESISVLSCISNLPSQKLKIVSVYRRDAVCFATFIDEFSSFVCDLSLSKYPFIIAGDFNIHMNDSRHSYTKRFTKLCKEQNLSLKNVPTVKTHIAGNTIDFLLCDANTDSLVIECFVDMDAPYISHHYPIIYSIKTSFKCRSLAVTSPKRTFRNFNLEDFKNDLSYSLSDLHTHASFKDKVENFQQHLKNCYDKHAPLQVSKILHNERPKWMDHEYVVQRALRRKLERKFKQTKSIHDEINFKMQRTKCALLVGEKVDKWYSSMIETTNGNSRSLFKMYETMTGNSSHSSQPKLPDVEDHGGKLGLANAFNKYFMDKVDKTKEYIKSQLIHQQNSSTNHLPRTFHETPQNVPYLTNFKLCDAQELKEILFGKFLNTTHGIDPLPRNLMSDALEVLLPHLCDLVNLSLSSGSIDGIKFSHVKPLLKDFTLDFSEFLSFRPISNLSFLSKLIERVVARRLNEHMTENNLHVDSQHGYKSNHSTETLLVKFLSDILVAVDRGRGVVVLMIDLSSAFDTDQHGILLRILKDSLHIRGTALEWFRSFLCGRTQSVKIDGILSDWLPVPCGVPQGSVLGPILFNIYCRYVNEIFKECGFSSASYADDNSACLTFALFNQLNTLYNDVPNCLQKLKEYMLENHLKLNEGKTQIIVFGSQKFNQQITLHGTFLRSGECIRFNDCVKYLGILFDSFLSFENQIQKVTTASYISLRKISSVRNRLSKSNLETLVHAFISSQLDYCNVLYVNLPKKLLNKLQKLQNAAIRVIFNVRSRHPVTSLFEQLHWLTVDQRIIFKCLLLVYKSINGLAPNVLDDMVVIRNKNNLTLHNVYYNHSKYGKRAFIYYASRFWNNIPTSIRLSSNVSTFKTALKSYLFLHFRDFKLKLTI